MANNSNNAHSLPPLNGGGNGNGDQRRNSTLIHPQSVSGINAQELGAAGGTQGGMNLSRIGPVVMTYPNGLGQTFPGQFCQVVNNYGYGTVELHFNQPIMPFGPGPVAHNTGPTANNAGHLAETVMQSSSPVAAAATPAPKKKNPPKPRKKAAATVEEIQISD